MLSVTTLATFACALLCCTAVHGNEENEIFDLTIAEDGDNNITCLSGDTSCLTLDYVLNNLGSEYPSNSDPVTVRIEVQYEHVVSRIDGTFYSSTNIEVYSEKPTNLCFNRTDYFSGSSRSNILRGNHNVSIYFTDLMLHGCDDIDSREVAPVTLQFLGFRTVTLHRCSVVNGSSLELLIRNVSQTAITSCKFHHSSFSAGALLIHYTPYIEKKVKFLIKDSEFNNNTASGVVYAAFFPVLSQAITFNIPYLRSSLENLTVVIDNCTVKSIARWISSPIIRVGVENSDRIVSGNFVFKNMIFSNLGGFGDFIYLDISSYNALSDNSSIKIDVIKCEFVNNWLYSASFVKALFQGQSQTQLDVTDSLFYGNKASCMGIRTYTSINVTVSLRNSLVEANDGEQLFDMYCRSLGCSVIFDKVNMTENVAADLTENPVSIVDPTYAVVEITFFSVKVENSTFYRNFGTPLHLTRSNLTFVGESSFMNNFGLRGGAMALHDLIFLKFEKKGRINCQYNVADFGGAVYLSSVNSNNCYFDSSVCFDNHFLGNRGLIDGNVLYVTDQTTAFCVKDYAERCLNNATRDVHQVGTPTVFQNFTSDRARIFPGQNIPFGLKVLNFFNNSAVINVRVILQCNGHWFLCEGHGYTLTGPHLATFTSREVAPSEYVLNVPSENFNSSHNLGILVAGQEQLSILSTLILEVLPCPYGFAFNSDSGNCECLHLDRKFYFCSQRQGIACVAQGYWLGDVNNGTNSIAYCNAGGAQCNRQLRPCPAIINSASVSFMELFQDSDDQCTDNFGGILCASCRNGANHTFEGLLCIPSEDCHQWQPYFLLVLSLVFQISSCILLLGMLRLKLGFGLGYLYGPVFFLAVATELPLTSTSEFSTLRAMVSFVTSIFFLDLEWLGFVPLCTFNIGRLCNYAIRYIGPVIASLVIFMTFLIARKCPRLLAFLQESPVQAICLLSFLSFWSLVETSWTILSFQDVSGVYTEIRVFLQPDISYFTGVHIFLAIIALVVIFFLVLPFTLFLFCTPCLGRKFNLTRIKPILDEFHSCYKINYRWYSGVYIIAWIVLITFSFSRLLILTELAILLFSHILLQPYQNKWLNIIDALLLTDCLFLYSILSQDNLSYFVGMKIFLVYILVLLPFLYIFLGLLLIVAQRTGCLNYTMKLIKMKKNKNKKFVTSTVVVIDNPILTTDIQMSYADVQQLREPLLEDKL